MIKDAYTYSICPAKEATFWRVEPLVIIPSRLFSVALVWACIRTFTSRFTANQSVAFGAAVGL